MPSIPIPIIKFGKTKEKSQLCEVFTIDGRQRQIDFPAKTTFIDDGERAFLINENNQYFDKQVGVWVQPIFAAHVIPLQFREKDPLADNINDDQQYKNLVDNLFKITAEEKQSKQYAEANANEAWGKFIWIITIVFGTLLAVAAIVKWG